MKSTLLSIAAAAIAILVTSGPVLAHHGGRRCDCACRFWAAPRGLARRGPMDKRDCTSNNAATGFIGLNLESPTQRPRAVAHDTQAQAVGRFAFGWERSSVVLDGEDKLLVFERQGDRNAFRLAVLDGVTNGFLGDFVELQTNLLRQRGEIGRSQAAG